MTTMTIIEPYSIAKGSLAELREFLEDFESKLEKFKMAGLTDAGYEYFDSEIRTPILKALDASIGGVDEIYDTPEYMERDEYED